MIHIIHDRATAQRLKGILETYIKPAVDAECEILSGGACFSALSVDEELIIPFAILFSQ